MFCAADYMVSKLHESGAGRGQDTGSDKETSPLFMTASHQQSIDQPLLPQLQFIRHCSSLPSPPIPLVETSQGETLRTRERSSAEIQFVKRHCEKAQRRPREAPILCSPATQLLLYLRRSRHNIAVPCHERRFCRIQFK